MYQDPREKYLENEVLSASPQKIRKLLIEGAIRFCRMAITHWQQQDFEKGLDATDRVRDIFTELLASTQQTPENQPIISVYHFLNREVTIASFEHSRERMSDVIRILEIEQETWSQVVSQLAAPSTNASQPAPHYPANALDNGSGSGSLSSGAISWEA